jgi:RNA polymerase sigma-70 factor, ECF subfamily
MPSIDELSDEDLIGRIAQGDRSAFALLYQRRRSDVYRFALHVGGSATVAEDVTQDVFVTLIHHAHRYEPGRSGAVPWLLGIARNHVRRGLARERHTAPLGEEHSNSVAAGIDPLADLMRREELVRLRQALLELPVRFREAVVLCDLHELNYEDAAAALRCAIGTVRSRLHRGRKRLADRLGTDARTAPLRIAAKVL